MNKWHRNYIIRRYFYGPFLKAFSHLFFMFSKIIPESWYSLNKPIFVVGCSRSGTTIFIEYFKYHLDLCNWSEAAQIMELDYYNPEIDHLKNESDVTEFDKFRIQAFFGFKTKLFRKKRFVNKHPENSLRIRYIKKIFPDAIFVHIIRDGRAVVESNYSRSKIDLFRSYYPFGDFVKPPKWREYLCLPLLEQFAHQWVDVVSYIRETAKEILSPNEYKEIRYEEWCERPHEILYELDLFCELDPNRRIYNKIPKKFKNYNYEWKERLSAEEVERINRIIEPLNKELGYY